MDKRTEIQAFKPIEFEKYVNIGLDHLLMYVVSSLEAIGADLSYENITMGAFRLFPKKFGLTSYPDFPDGKRAHDSIFHCFYKSKGWLTGKTSHGYSISPKGRQAIKEAEFRIKGRSSSRKAPSKTRRKEALIEDLKNSIAFNKASKGEISEITESEFCNMLQVTLDAPPAIRNANFDALLIYSDEIGDIEANKILAAIEAQFKNYMKWVER